MNRPVAGVAPSGSEPLPVSSGPVVLPYKGESHSTSHSGRTSLTDALVHFLRCHPNVWYDGRRFMQIAGAYGWRSRVSDARHRGLDIRNRQRRVKTPDGRAYVISEYRYVPRTLLDVAEVQTSEATA
jgi:hypothetical protein